MAIRHREVFPVGSAPDSISWEQWNDGHVVEAADGTPLAFGAIADGEFLKRVGDEIVGAAGTVQSATLHLTAAQIAAFQSGGLLTVVPAPGADKVILPLYVTTDFKYGSTWYWKDGAAVAVHLYWGDDTNFGEVGSFTWPTQGHFIGTDRVGYLQFSGIGVGTAQADNLPVKIQANANPTPWGILLTSTKAAGGSGYAPGDTGLIDFGDPSLGSLDVEGFMGYVVDTVDGGGAVLTYHLAAASYGGSGPPLYDLTHNPVSTDATSGIGTGFTVNVTGVSPIDGDLYITIYYAIETVR